MVVVPVAPAPTLQYRTERRGLKGLVIAGSITFGVSYILNIAITSALDSDSDLKLISVIPVAGPWIMYADDRTEGYKGALFLDGALQAAGLTMFILGVAIRREVQVPFYASADGTVRVGMSAVPTPGGSALVMGGHF